MKVGNLVRVHFGFGQDNVSYLGIICGFADGLNAYAEMAKVKWIAPLDDGNLEEMDLLPDYWNTHELEAISGC